MMIRETWKKAKEILDKSFVGFTVNKPMFDTNLLPSDKLVFYTLNASCFNEDGRIKDFCFVSQKYLAYITGLCVRTVARAIKKLAQLGYIHVVHRIGGTNIYKIPSRTDKKTENKVNEVKDSFTKKNKKKGFDKKEKPSTFNNFEQRSYDFDSLEKQLLGWETPKENQYGEIFSQALLL